MRSVCVKCGKTKSQACRFARPIGRLWAWLTFDCGGDRRLHEDHEPLFPEREAARHAFFWLDGIDRWLHAEAGDGDPYDEDP